MDYLEFNKKYNEIKSEISCKNFYIELNNSFIKTVNELILNLNNILKTRKDKYILEDNKIKLAWEFAISRYTEQINDYLSSNQRYESEIKELNNNLKDLIETNKEIIKNKIQFLENILNQTGSVLKELKTIYNKNISFYDYFKETDEIHCEINEKYFYNDGKIYLKKVGDDKYLIKRHEINYYRKCYIQLVNLNYNWSVNDNNYLLSYEIDIVKNPEYLYTLEIINEDGNNFEIKFKNIHCEFILKVKVSESA